MYGSILFLDLQAVRPVCFCEICGGERYWPSLICLRCEKGGLGCVLRN